MKTLLSVLTVCAAALASADPTLTDPTPTLTDPNSTLTDPNSTLTDPNLTLPALVAQLNSTADGRKLLHGSATSEKSQTVDTNALYKTTVTVYAYPDGYIYAATNVTPFRPTLAASGGSGAHPPSVAALPDRLRRLREEREANAQTNWVYSFSGRIQRTPRKFSVMKITAAVTAMGLWPDARDYMATNNLLQIYYTANDFREDNPIFLKGVRTFQDRYHLTSDQIEAVLRECLYEDD